jgi:UDP-arabinose 4-epimerase
MKNRDERTVLVTGAAGYIGRFVTRELRAAGRRVVRLDLKNIPAGPADDYFSVNLADRDATLAALEKIAPAALIHLAGLIQVGESVREPEKYWRVNVSGSVNLFEAARASGVQAVVFSSSAAVYGEPEKIPLDESMAMRPVSPYGKSKAVVESLLADCEAAGGPRWAALRYFNAAGAALDGSDGEDHEPETHLIPRLLDAVTSGKPAQLFGEDYPTPDGTAVRDYIHVEDLARGHLGALDYLLGGGASAPFNLGSGTGASVREVIAGVEKITGRSVPLERGPRRAGDSAVLVASPVKARAAFGFTAAHDLEAIIRSAWVWHQGRAR